MSLIAKQFNPGDPIDINTLNQMIVAINTLATQVAQIYRLPSPQATITVNNNGTSGSQNGEDAGGTANTTLIAVPLKVNTNQYVGFNNSFNRTTATLSKADVEKAAGRVVKDFRITNVSYSPLRMVRPGKTDQTTATGIRIDTTIYGDGKTWQWWLVKDGLVKYVAGENAPSTTWPSTNRRIYFSWTLDVEISY